MKTLYLECNMGAAGDMLTAALLELHPQPENFLRTMNALGLPGVHVEAESATRCGIRGTHMRVTIDGTEEGCTAEHAHEHAHSHDHVHTHDHPHDHDHAHDHEHPHGHDHAHPHEAEHAHEHAAPHTHSALHDIEARIDALPLPAPVRDHARAVYALLAQAESRAHGRPVEQIHFHEVGTLDALADIVGVCLLLHELAPDKIVVSPVHVGSGQVRCAHGVLPVPAPATAYLLQGMPIYGGAVRGELCTPTGAALLRHFADDFGAMPVMAIQKIGYGMGNREFEHANCVRAMLGESEDAGDTVLELRCNLDDMTPEALAFATERLLESGARDVFTTPVHMKKGRTGMLLTCVCDETQREAMLHLLFAHTTTLGVRENVCRRAVLTRGERTAHTPYGEVRVKTASGWGVSREKPEYEDIAQLARTQGVPLAEIVKHIGCIR